MSEQEILIELAVSLYAAKKISFGKAHRFANVNCYRFREILSERGIPAHYEMEQLEEDLKNLETLPAVS